MDAILLGPGEGERLDDSTLIRAGREEVALTEFAYPPGRRGPGPHVHHRHADCFYVLEGEFTFPLGAGGELVRGGPGAYVQVPPNVVHTFRNDGPASARLLNLHAPSEGFHDYLRAMRRGERVDFDTADPPDDGGRPTTDAVVRPAGEGRLVRLGATSVLIRAGADDEPGSLALIESTLPAGSPGPVLHRHNRTSDSFYVLEGTLTVTVGEREADLAASSYALVPPGVPHTFANRSDRETRVLNAMFPGGFERYFVEAAAALPADAPPDPAVLAELASRYDFEPAA